MKKLMIGFTLIEVMITVAIIGILVTIAYPSYTQYVAESNRSEGKRELLRIANLMEQRFLDTRAYTNDLTLLGLSANPYITEEGGSHYSISATVVGTSFTLTATARGHQLSIDSDCSTLSVTDSGALDAASDNCWD